MHSASIYYMPDIVLSFVFVFLFGEFNPHNTCLTLVLLLPSYMREDKTAAQSG